MRKPHDPIKYKIYYEKNKERLRLKARLYRASHIEQQLASARRWQRANPARVLEHVRNWAKNNPEKFEIMRKKAQSKYAPKAAIKNRIWNEKNRERVNERARINYRKNCEARRLSLIASKHKRRCASGVLNTEVLKQVYDINLRKYGLLTCELCYSPIDVKTQRKSIEHFLPLSRGGDNSISNLGIAHLSCNLKKNRKTIEEFKALVR